MNTVEMKSAFPEVSGLKAANVVDFTQQKSALSSGVTVHDDTYSASNANDAVAAKVIALSINSRFETVLPQRATEQTEQAVKAASIQPQTLFDIDEVVNNVLNFVSSSLTAMVGNGANEEDIVYFKQQATEGVNYGIEQAKKELSGINDETLTKNINLSQERIIKGIQEMPEDVALYASANDGSNDKYNEINIVLNSDQRAAVDFGIKAFSKAATQNENEVVFTTQGSNTSFSVSGNISSDQIGKLADLINNTDEVLNTFYRKNMQSALNKAEQLGYTVSDIKNLSKQMEMYDNASVAMAYDQIKHLDGNADREDLSSPKALAQYLSRMMSVMETANNELGSQEEFKQVINGLVNQMKDVQVPDLVEAINRFHAFNAKFEGDANS